MVFQFPNFILLWGCAITLFSDFALLCFNMTVLHTAVVPRSSALPPKILLSTTRLLHEPEESFCSLFSPGLLKPTNVGNVSAIKVSFLMPPIRHNQINSSLSHTFHRIHTSLWSYHLVIPLILRTMLELLYSYCYYDHAVTGAGAIQIYQRENTFTRI